MVFNDHVDIIDWNTGVEEPIAESATSNEWMFTKIGRGMKIRGEFQFLYRLKTCI
jgi:hypothetical protein